MPEYKRIILKAIQAGRITQAEGLQLLKNIDNIPVRFWVSDENEPNEFFDLCEKAGIELKRIMFVD